MAAAGRDTPPRVRVVFAGGGTGGHLTPALAVAEAVLEVNPDSKVLFIGAEGGIEGKAVPEAGYELQLLPSTKPPSGLVGRGIHAPVILWRLLAARRKVRAILRDFGAQVVVGTGGYVSAAPLWAAARERIPAVLLEQNALPGKTNRFISRWAVEVHVPFDESLHHFPEGKARLTGNPVRRAVRSVRRDGRKEKGEVLLVTGGSQGAQRLNEITARALPELAEKMPGLELLLLSGREGATEIMDAFTASGLSGEVHEFTAEMESFYERADLVLSRAGGTTIAELSCVGLPAVLVPYPYAADKHQDANARAVEAAGAAVVLDQGWLGPGQLVDTVVGLLGDRERLSRMASAAKKLGRPDAAVRIAERIYELAGRT